MKSADVLINVRKTGKGEPKGSYTVHADPTCRSAAGRAKRNPRLWASSTMECVDELSSIILFGACGICGIGSMRADAWAAAGPSARNQMRYDKAKLALETCAA